MSSGPKLCTLEIGRGDYSLQPNEAEAEAVDGGLLRKICTEAVLESLSVGIYFGVHSGQDVHLTF